MTVNGVEVDNKQIDLRVNSIKKNLYLEKNDIVLDICCGNGLITELLSTSVKYIYAVDFSEGLIEVAKSNSNNTNIRYETGDITKIKLGSFQKINKISVYSGVQCISFVELKSFLKKIQLIRSPLLVYISNIPDRDKIWDYYDTREKMAFFHKMEDEGKTHIGTWYDKAKIINFLKSLGLGYKIININCGLNTHYYRFDLLIEKK